jgi:hypothetical protein
VNVFEAPDDVDRPWIVPRRRHDQRLIGMDVHRSRAGHGDIGGEVGDQPLRPDGRLDQCAGDRMAQQFDEKRIPSGEMVEPYVGLVGIERFAEGVDALGAHGLDDPFDGRLRALEKIA